MKVSVFYSFQIRFSIASAGSVPLVFVGFCWFFMECEAQNIGVGNKMYVLKQHWGPFPFAFYSSCHCTGIRINTPA